MTRYVVYNEGGELIIEIRADRVEYKEGMMLFTSNAMGAKALVPTRGFIVEIRSS